jgi:hypothetical protein
VRFITQYAAEESNRLDLGIQFTALLPQLTPATDLGRIAVAAYARRSGMTQDEYIAQLGAPLTPQLAGRAVLQLLTDPMLTTQGAFLLTSAGLKPLE